MQAGIGPACNHSGNPAGKLILESDMAYDVKLLLNIAARFESASTYVIRAGDAAMGNQRDNIGEALRIARGALDDLTDHVEQVDHGTPLVEDAPPPTLESYTMQVQTALIREGANSGLDTADTAVVVVGSIKGVGPNDCAAQIIANRHDAAERTDWPNLREPLPPSGRQL